MTQDQIISKCRDFGTQGDARGFGVFSADHTFVVRDPKAVRNIGKVPAIDMLRAYADGARG